MASQPSRVVNITESSLRSLMLQLRFDGQTLGSATGFVVKSSLGPLLITNRHNVTGRHQETDQPLSRTGGIPNELLIFHNSDKGVCVWQPCLERLYDGDKPRWIEHPTLGAKADFVALPLHELRGVQLYPYLLERSESKITVGPADVVSVVGFPFGMTAGGYLAIWATGFVASEPEVDFRDLPVFLIDCQSGSAVIAYRHSGLVTRGTNIVAGSGPVSSLLGIYSGRISEESDLGLVWKDSAIRQLVESLPAPAAT
jgi:hypothetical protein